MISLPPVNSPKPPADGRKSQRYLDVDERLENDMQVTASMQTYMHKKLHEILEQRIEFVDQTDTTAAKISSNQHEPDNAATTESSMRLFSDSAEPFVLRQDAATDEGVDGDVVEQSAQPSVRQKRPKIRKRKVLIDDEVDVSEAEKLQQATVSTDDLKHEVSAWKQRSKPDRLIEYKEHASKILYRVEPDTEFTAKRKRNNWSDGKIARK